LAILASLAVAATLLLASPAVAGAARLAPPATARPVPGLEVAAPVAGRLAAAQQPPAPTTSIAPDETLVPIPRIIPLPNSGHKPADAGDPGGFLQVSLFFFICGAIVLICGLIYLDARRKKRRREAATSTSATAAPRHAG
jgi:hypothetical protein